MGLKVIVGEVSDKKEEYYTLQNLKKKFYLLLKWWSRPELNWCPKYKYIAVYKFS